MAANVVTRLSAGGPTPDQRGSEPAFVVGSQAGDAARHAQRGEPGREFLSVVIGERAYPQRPRRERLPQRDEVGSAVGIVCLQSPQLLRAGCGMPIDVDHPQHPEQLPLAYLGVAQLALEPCGGMPVTRAGDVPLRWFHGEGVVIG